MLLKTRSCGGSGTFGSAILRDQYGGLKVALIENVSRRYVAAGGRDQQQDRDGRPVAAIRQRRQKVILETLVPMSARAGTVAGLGQKIAHAAMGMNVIRIDPQRASKCSPRLLQFAEQKQQVCQIDLPGGIVRMMSDSFAEQRARGFLISGIENQRAEIIERAKIGRRPPKKFEIVALWPLRTGLVRGEDWRVRSGLSAHRDFARCERSRACIREVTERRPRICSDLAHIDPGSGESVGANIRTKFTMTANDAARGGVAREGANMEQD